MCSGEEGGGRGGGGVMLEEVSGLEKLNILNVMVDYRFTKNELFTS